MNPVLKKNFKIKMKEFCMNYFELELYTRVEMDLLEEVSFDDVQHALVLTEEQCPVLTDY